MPRLRAQGSRNGDYGRRGSANGENDGGAAASPQLEMWNETLCGCRSLAELSRPRLRKLLAGGVPPQHRAHVWAHASGAHEIRAKYAALAERVEAARGDGGGGVGGGGVSGGGGGTGGESAAARDRDHDHDTAGVVERDLLRTFPEHPAFRSLDAPLVPPLRRVLLAHALHNRSVGYCQGLNFVAAIMLLHADEATAFALLCALSPPGVRYDASSGEGRTTRDRGLLPDYHTPGMGGLQRGQATLMRALEHAVPAVHGRLTQLGVPVAQYSTQWLLCLYIDVLPLETALRLWDLLFAEGEAVLLRAPLAVCALHEASLVASDDFGATHAAFHAALDATEPDALMRTVVEPQLVRAVADAAYATSPAGECTVATDDAEMAARRAYLDGENEDGTGRPPNL